MSGPDVAPVVLGLLSAASWGAGDFCGGLATRRTRVSGVIVASQIVGALLLVGLALAFAEPVPPVSDLLWGGAAGLAGALGLAALYRALAAGRMGVAAPVSAVITAVIPVVFGVIVEDLPGAPQLIGFGLALVAVWFISRTEGSPIQMQDLGLPAMAGLGFGAFFILIHRASDAAVLWPLVGARVTSLSTLLTLALFFRRAWLPAGNRLPLIALAGMLDAGGNAFFVLAAQAGRLDAAAVLSSLYPAATVWLAWLILKERLTRPQVAGVGAALAAIVLISL